MVNRFLEIFSGLDRAHGEYTITGQKGAKAIGKAITKQSPVTEKLWADHLNGRVGIGIVPIRDDNTCVFGAIDIDCYENFDPVVVSNTVEENKWPLVVCRSKSGGAHVFLFTSEPVPAILIRSKLKAFAMALGHPKAEIFPKQDRLFSKDDTGNWINMPYFESKKTMRYAIKEAVAVDVKDFPHLVNEREITRDELEELDIGSGEFSDAPPCLETLSITGFPDGSMNNALFNLGVYARMKYPEDWHVKIYDYNQRFLGPGSPKEVQQILKSLEKKKYIYRCNEQPICGVCDKAVCNVRKFGISSESLPYKGATTQKTSRPCILDEIEGQIECYLPPHGSDDEPYWVFVFSGTPMDVTIDMVSSQIKFLREYLKKFRRMVLPIDETRWMVAINALLVDAKEFELAPDAGPEGQLWLHLEAFCNGKVQARTKEELVLGKPWRDKENTEAFGDRIFFRSQDLVKYLDMQRFKQFKERQIYAIMRKKGTRHHKFMIKGTCVSCWSTEPYNSAVGTMDIPDMAKDKY